MAVVFSRLGYTNISCVSSCLVLLEVSIKFTLIELTKLCLIYLRDNVTQFNVQMILSSLEKINSKSLKILAGKNHLYHEFSNNQQNDDDSLKNLKNLAKNLDSTIDEQESVENLFNELISRCYQLIDANAETILRSEAICDLERETLINILSRDSLNLSNELTAFECVQRWSESRFKQDGREIGHKTILNLLGRDGIFSVRYLTMSLKSFMKGPYASGILSEQDKDYLLSKLLDPSNQIPSDLTGYKLDIPRKYVKPINQDSLPQAKFGQSTALAIISPFDGKKKSAIKKFLHGLRGVIIFALRILD